MVGAKGNLRQTFVLHSRFYTKEQLGIKDFSVQIIDATDVNNLTERERCWIEKLCTSIPNGT